MNVQKKYTAQESKFTALQDFAKYKPSNLEQYEQRQTKLILNAFNTLLTLGCCCIFIFALNGALTV